MVGSLQRGAERTVLDYPTSVAYSDGRLFSVRNGTLLVQKFDASNATVNGPPRAIANDVDWYAPRATALGVAFDPAIDATRKACRWLMPVRFPFREGHPDRRAEWRQVLESTTRWVASPSPRTIGACRLELPDEFTVPSSRVGRHPLMMWFYSCEDSGE
jgi:hypothetical protein